MPNSQYETHPYDTDPERDAKVATALAGYDRRCESGDSVDLWEFVALRMDIAAELVLHFRSVNEFDAVVAPRPVHSAHADPTAELALIQPLGSGGMGIVY